VSSYFNWLHIINLNTNSTTACLTNWSPYQQLLFSLFIPIILLIELLCMAGIHLILHRQYGHQSSIQNNNNNNDQQQQQQHHQHGILVKLFFKFISTYSFDRYIGGGLSILLF